MANLRPCIGVPGERCPHRHLLEHGSRCYDCKKVFVQRRNQRPEHLARVRLPEAQRRRILARDGRCGDCGTTEQLTIDHITPLITGKRFYRDDELRTLCRSCNSRRGGALSRGGQGHGT